MNSVRVFSDDKDTKQLRKLKDKAVTNVQMHVFGGISLFCAWGENWSAKLKKLIENTFTKIPNTHKEAESAALCHYQIFSHDTDDCC